jgi:hypothetical protein
MFAIFIEWGNEGFFGENTTHIYNSDIIEYIKYVYILCSLLSVKKKNYALIQ